MPYSELRAEILARVGLHSYGKIASDLGCSRNVVAGIIFRHRNPNMKRNYRGHCGPGVYAAETLRRSTHFEAAAHV